MAVASPGRQQARVSTVAVQARPRARLPRWAVILVVGFVTLTLRAVNLDHAWEIHIDEITYLRLSESVATHLAVTLYGQPFYLHPPAYFFLEGGLLRLLEPAGSTIDRIYMMRSLNIGFAELTAVLALLISWRLGGWWAGILTAALFALDPFVVRINSRTLLETSALFWVSLGYWFLLPAPGLPRQRLMRAAAAGVAFGLALLTKDMTALLTLAPVGFCLLTNWWLSRRAAGLVIVVTVLTYTPYPVLVALFGDWPAFAVQKLGGISRFAGLLKITGFRPGGPSFVEAIATNLDRLGSTYLLFALGGLALLVLLVSGVRRYRPLVLWTASAYGLLSYCVLFGTLEEQFFYFLAVPTVVAVGVACPLGLRMLRQPSQAGPRWLPWGGLRRPTLTDPRRRMVRDGLCAFMGLLLAWNAVVWLRVHSTPDNGYERMLAYLHASVPARTPVAAGTEAAEFLLDDYTTGKWESPSDLRAHQARYVVVSARQVEAGYALGSPAFFAWVAAHGDPVWQFAGPTHKVLSVYRLRSLEE